MVIAVKGNRVVVRNTVGKASGAGSLSLDKAYAYDKVSRELCPQQASTTPSNTWSGIATLPMARHQSILSNPFNPGQVCVDADFTIAGIQPICQAERGVRGMRNAGD